MQILVGWLPHIPPIRFGEVSEVDTFTLIPDSLWVSAEIAAFEDQASMSQVAIHIMGCHNYKSHII